MPGPAAKARPVAAVGGSGKIVISVAKRLVPSAVRRNTVKRIVREAWRAASGGASESSQQGAESSSAPASVQDSPAGRVAADQPRVCLVRLKRYPGKDLKEVKKKAVPVKAAGAATIGLTAIKRSLRSDADQLFAAFQSGRARHRRSPAPRNV